MSDRWTGRQLTSHHHSMWRYGLEDQLVSGGRPDSMGTALSNKGVNSPTINLLAKGLLFTARETSKDQAAENMQTLKGEWVEQSSWNGMIEMSRKCLSLSLYVCVCTLTCRSCCSGNDIVSMDSHYDWHIVTDFSAERVQGAVVYYPFF